MGKNKEEMIKQMRELNERLLSLTERIEQLTEQVKKQQPIVINPSPVWPTNDPTQPTQPYPWWQYTPTITSTNTDDIITVTAPNYPTDTNYIYTTGYTEFINNFNTTKTGDAK